MIGNKVNKYNLLMVEGKELNDAFLYLKEEWNLCRKSEMDGQLFRLLHSLLSPEDTRLFTDCESFDELEEWYAVCGYDKSIIPPLTRFLEICKQKEWFRLAHNVNQAINEYKKYYDTQRIL